MNAMGTWFIQEVGDEDESNKECLLYDYSIKRNKRSPSVIVANYYHQQIRDSNAHNIKLIQVGNTSEYTINWNGKIRSGWTVGTDYDSWCVAYLCFPEDPNKGILYIGTRKMKPSKKSMESAHLLIKHLGFNTNKNYLKPVHHSNCNFTRN
nr:uncharacterized protein LOC111424804 [Onthophagus taurus]